MQSNNILIERDESNNNLDTIIKYLDICRNSDYFLPDWNQIITLCNLFCVPYSAVYKLDLL